MHVNLWRAVGAWCFWRMGNSPVCLKYRTGKRGQGGWRVPGQCLVGHVKKIWALSCSQQWALKNPQAVNWCDQIWVTPKSFRNLWGWWPWVRERLKIKALEWRMVKRQKKTMAKFSSKAVLERWKEMHSEDNLDLHSPIQYPLVLHMW